MACFAVGLVAIKAMSFGSEFNPLVGGFFAIPYATFSPSPGIVAWTPW